MGMSVSDATATKAIAAAADQYVLPARAAPTMTPRNDETQAHESHDPALEERLNQDVVAVRDVDEVRGVVAGRPQLAGERAWSEADQDRVQPMRERRPPDAETQRDRLRIADPSPELPGDDCEQNQPQCQPNDDDWSSRQRWSNASRSQQGHDPGNHPGQPDGPPAAHHRDEEAGDRPDDAQGPDDGSFRQGHGGRQQQDCHHAHDVLMEVQERRKPELERRDAGARDRNPSNPDRSPHDQENEADDDAQQAEEGDRHSPIPLIREDSARQVEGSDIGQRGGGGLERSPWRTRGDAGQQEEEETGQDQTIRQVVGAGQVAKVEHHEDATGDGGDRPDLGGKPP